jgi:hypothetical protein
MLDQLGSLQAIDGKPIGDQSGLDLFQRRIPRGDVVLLLDGDMVTRLRCACADFLSIYGRRFERQIKSFG